MTPIHRRSSSEDAATPAASTAPRGAGRLRELDGLRGLAAVVVLIHHCLLTVPALAEVGARPGTVPGGALERLLALTPAHLLWGGYEAVLVFFILLFSPVTFPASQLPRWFQSVHDWLPIRPAADLLRAGLAQDAYAWHGRDLAILLAWMLVSLGVCLRALSRR